jgi:tRNA(Ile)-lysidine synthase
VAFAHVQAVLDCAAEGVPSDLPGQHVQREASEVVLRKRPEGTWPGRGRGVKANLFRYPLSIPGEVEIAEAGCVVSAEAAPSMAAAGLSAVPRSRDTAVVRFEGLRALAVRNRRPGDCFKPLGLGGRKKLQDFFVDRKVIRSERDRVPLVVDAADRIIWVSGHAIADEFRITDPAQAVLILRLRQV